MRPITMPLRFASRSSAVALGVLLLASSAFAEEEKNFQTDLEVVAGAGEVDALNIVPTGFTTGGLRYDRGLTNVTAVGIVLSGRYELSNHFSVGARFPVAVGDLRPDSDTSRGTANLGNVEVEVEYETELGEHAVLFFGAHVAAPTSSGSELPNDETLAGNQANIDPLSADKYSINKAVSSAFGNENTALWLAGYLGLIPAAGVKLHFGRLRVDPYVKLESMFSVRPEADERVIVELVTGVRVSVKVIEMLDVGVRAWGAFTLTNHEGDENVGVIEPEVRVGKKDWRITAGVLVPFAGELTNPQWIAGRLSATVAF